MLVNQNGPRPKFHNRAKRESGGLIIFYKNINENALELVFSNGIIWFKLKHQLQMLIEINISVYLTSSEDSV
jgi:hypothetical protein